MPIETGVPSNIRSPGSYHTFVFTAAVAGLLALPQRVALVGMKSAAGTATAEQPVEVFDGTDADAKFGAGSELALMCRKAFEQGMMNGGAMPKIWGCPIAEPGAGTAHAKTLTFTGPATQDGNVEFTVAGRPIIVGVANGASANTIAAAVEKALDSKANTLPVTAGVAAAVVTCTHVTKGENGQDVDYTTKKLPTGVGLAYADGAAGAGVVDITNALDALLDKDYDAVAIANRKAADITDAKANTTIAWGFAQKRYRHIVMGDPTTLSAAQTLAAASNDYTVIIASCEDSPSLPGEIATAVAVYAWAKDRPNANCDYGKLALYPPPLASSVFTATERESLLEAGVTPLIPTAEGDALQIVRLVTTKVTTNSAPDYATFDLAVTRTAAYRARQIDARYAQEFPQELMVVDPDDPSNVLLRVADMIFGVDTTMEAARMLRDVEALRASLQVVESATQGRVDADSWFRVVSPLHQLACRHHGTI